MSGLPLTTIAPTATTVTDTLMCWSVGSADRWRTTIGTSTSAGRSHQQFGEDVLQDGIHGSILARPLNIHGA